MGEVGEGRGLFRAGGLAGCLDESHAGGGPCISVRQRGLGLLRLSGALARAVRSGRPLGLGDVVVVACGGGLLHFCACGGCGGCGGGVGRRAKGLYVCIQTQSQGCGVWGGGGLGRRRKVGTKGGGGRGGRVENACRTTTTATTAPSRRMRREEEQEGRKKKRMIAPASEHASTSSGGGSNIRLMIIDRSE